MGPVSDHKVGGLVREARAHLDAKTQVIPIWPQSAWIQAAQPTLGDPGKTPAPTVLQDATRAWPQCLPPTPLGKESQH